MRESQFIKQNKEKWIKFEQLLKLDIKDADNLSDSFIQITDDLSYSKTFFNNRFIRIYLNNLCQQLFFSIYKTRKKTRGKKLISFWKEELPQIIFQSRSELLTALIIFILSMAIGVVSSANDPEFSKTILGEDYIQMTLDNIVSGDPMGVYKSSNEVDMFLGITFNNVMVAFRTFLMGIFFTLGALVILIYNGIMVGTFQYFFIERDLFLESFLTIWLHGTLEISSIVIAGASGIVLGKGLISPGTFSRIQSFQLSAKRGVKLLMSIIPILVLAAIIESFLTRYTEAPDWIRLSLILVSLGYMLSYFVWYPMRKFKNSTLKAYDKDELQETAIVNVQYHGIIKSASEIMKDIFSLYKKHGKRIMKLNFIFSAAYIPIALFLLLSTLDKGQFNYADWYFNKLVSFINYLDQPGFLLINATFFATYFVLLLVPLKTKIKQEQSKKKTVYFVVNCLIVGILLHALLFIPRSFSVPIIILTLPTFILWMFVIVYEEHNLFISFKRSLFLIRSNISRIYGVYALICLVGSIGLVFINSPFPVFYIDFLTWNIPVSENSINSTLIIANSFISLLSFLIISPLLIVGMMLTYFSLLETKEPNGLLKKIDLISNES